MTNTPELGKPTEGHNPNIWTTPPPKDVKNLYPKKKAKWGMIEVVNSLVILIVLQIILALSVIGLTVSQTVARVGSSEDVNPADVEKAVYDVILSPPMIILSGVLMYLSWILMMWYSTRYRGHKSFAKDFWLKIHWKDVPLGLGLAVLLLGLVQGLSWIAEAIGIDLSGSDNTEIFKGHGRVWEIILIVGLVTLAGPIAEELFFRGFLLQGLIRHFRRGNISGPRGNFGLVMQRNNAGLFNAYISFRNFCYKHKYTLSIIISSVLFGFMHFNPAVPIVGGLTTVFITGLLGLVFAIVTVRTQRLSLSIFAHVFYNGMVGFISVLMV